MKKNCCDQKVNPIVVPSVTSTRNASIGERKNNIQGLVRPVRLSPQERRQLLIHVLDDALRIVNDSKKETKKSDGST
jgi:hypothetical protein